MKQFSPYYFSYSPQFGIIYNNRINAVAYVTNTTGVISQNQQTISYTPFLKADTITQNGYQLTYTYGANQERIESVLKRNDTTVETRIYLGAFERQIIGDTTRDIMYVSAGNGLCAIIVKQGNTITPYFVYSDHLGSILTVTDTSGNIVAQQNFDAWGRNRNPQDWTYTPPLEGQGEAWLYRGFEGHEMLTAFALINMNGRIYDPALARMISPDINITYPWSTQGYDRYGFALNNPLFFIDPTGNSFLSSIGHFFGGLGKDIGHLAAQVWDNKIIRDVLVIGVGVAAIIVTPIIAPAIGQGIAGALGVSNAVGTILAGAAIGAVQSVASTWIQNGSLTWETGLAAFAFGAISGAFQAGPLQNDFDNLIDGAGFVSTTVHGMPSILQGVASDVVGGLAGTAAEDVIENGWKGLNINDEYSGALSAAVSQIAHNGIGLIGKWENDNLSNWQTLSKNITSNLGAAFIGTVGQNIFPYLGNLNRTSPFSGIISWESLIGWDGGFINDQSNSWDPK